MGNQEKRSARRVPVNCEVKLRFRGATPSQYGICTDLSIGGMTVRTSYVPRLEEVFDVLMMPPAVGGSRKPFAATVRVRRCHELERGKLYELGLEIVEVLQ
jgi:hypothetical protein